MDAVQVKLHSGRVGWVGGKGEVFGLVGAQVVLGFQLRDAVGWGERGEQVRGREEVTAKSVQGIIGEQIGFDKFVEVEVMQSFKEKRANTGIPWDNKGNRQGGRGETGLGPGFSGLCSLCPVALGEKKRAWRYQQTEAWHSGCQVP